ncbi:hypothetical protein ACGFRG_08050 [Streptomyces sp. NPDC048696]|uniref:hypothetical protein n=1 Tax=Streptomyces sp. NPDC048696 TaxID=3365585 RepID=UPI003715C030
MLVPVQRAETFYLPPPTEPTTAWDLVPAAERVFRWVEYRAQRRVVPPEAPIVGHQVFARINHNRWVVDCPCGSAQVVSPSDARAACTECGYGWVRLIFPADPEAVEATLADQLPHLRNWWHAGDPLNPNSASEEVDA